MKVLVKVDYNQGVLTRNGCVISDNQVVPMSEEEQDYFRNVCFLYYDGSIQKINKKTREVAYEASLSDGSWNLGRYYAHKIVEFDDMDLRGKVFRVTKGKVERNRISFEDSSIQIPPSKEGRTPHIWEVCKKGSLKKTDQTTVSDYLFAVCKREKEIVFLVINKNGDEEKIVSSLQKAL